MAPVWVSTNCCNTSALRADTTTRAPMACKACAVARPMPLEAPISQTLRPVHSVMRGFMLVRSMSGFF